MRKKGLGFFSNDKGDMEAGKTVVAMCGSLLAGGLRFFLSRKAPENMEFANAGAILYAHENPSWASDKVKGGGRGLSLAPN